MATWVTQMVDDTDLTFASISTYVWGMRTWHVLQHQADPAMGVMHWKEFMSGVAVMTAVPGEPRRELPFEVMCDMLRMLQKSDSFKDKQLRLMLLTLFLLSHVPSALALRRGMGRTILIQSGTGLWLISNYV